MKRVRILEDDITTLEVDAIVNAANERMLGGGGVDGAIHRAAGPQLLEACRSVSEVMPGVRCPTGQSRITPGFRLPARFVIHTVGPVWLGGHAGEPQLLRGCYDSALALAVENGLRSVAFPAISCGVFAYPVQAAAAVVHQAMTDFFAADNSIESVLLVAFEADVLQSLQHAFDG